jgi:adenine-specific DNA-methyltransferase
MLLNLLSRTHGNLVNERVELQHQYEHLILAHQHLKKQYDDLRRPFGVTSEVPYTDVWVYPPVQYYPGKYPCEKSADLLEHVILTSSTEGQLVMDAFMGLGSAGKQCLKLNRNFIGVEMETPTFENTLVSLIK